MGHKPMSRLRLQLAAFLMLRAAHVFQEEESVIGRGRDETSESKRMATQVQSSVHLHPSRCPW